MKHQAHSFMGERSEPEEKETWVIKDIISDGALSLLLKHTTLYSAVFADLLNQRASYSKPRSYFLFFFVGFSEAFMSTTYG